MPSIGHWKNYIRALSSIDCVASNAFQEDNLPFEACTLTHEAVLQYRRCRGRRGVGQEQLLLKMRQGGVRSQVDSLDTGHRQPTPGQLVLHNKSTVVALALHVVLRPFDGIVGVFKREHGVGVREVGEVLVSLRLYLLVLPDL